MLKRMMALAVAFVMAFSLCACCCITQPVKLEERPSASEDILQPDSSVDEPDATMNVIEEIVVQAFTFGSVDDNCYENTFAGIGCQMPDDWTFMTDAEIKEANGITEGMVDAEDLAELYVIQDMYATAPNQMDTLNVIFEKVDHTITAESYATLSVGYAVESLESMGIEDVTYEIGTLYMAGDEQVAIAIEGTYMDVPVYETMVVMECEGYVMIVTACSWYEDTTAEYLNYFYAI